MQTAKVTNQQVACDKVGTSDRGPKEGGRIGLDDDDPPKYVERPRGE